MSSLWIELLGAETRFISANGIRTRVIEAGSGPVILFLHGAGGHAEAFARNIVPLSRNHRVVAMDYLGSGLTDYPDSCPTLKDRVDHIIGVMDALGIDQACLAGESFGGTQAFAAARLYPQRVSALIAIVGGAFDVGTDVASIDQWRQSMLTMVERQRAFLKNPSRETVRQRLAWLFHLPEVMITDELVEARWAFYQREPVRRAVYDMTIMIAEDVTARVSGRAPELRTDALRPMGPNDLTAITHRTLFLWTDHNPSTSANTARVAASFVPDAQFVLMEGCGHWPQWEDPDTFNRHVSEFLASAVQGGATGREWV